MIKREETKKRGKELLAFEGRCKRCKQLLRAYYVYADSKHQRLMESGSFINLKSNCPACVTNKFFQSPQTVEWFRQLPLGEVAKEFAVMDKSGINIDFDAVDSGVKEQTRQDMLAQEFDDEMAWRMKKQN